MRGLLTLWAKVSAVMQDGKADSQGHEYVYDLELCTHRRGPFEDWEDGPLGKMCVAGA